MYITSFILYWSRHECSFFSTSLYGGHPQSTVRDQSGGSGGPEDARGAACKFQRRVITGGVTLRCAAVKLLILEEDYYYFRPDRYCPERLLLADPFFLSTRCSFCRAGCALLDFPSFSLNFPFDSHVFCTRPLASFSAPSPLSMPSVRIGSHTWPRADCYANFSYPARNWRTTMFASGRVRVAARRETAARLFQRRLHHAFR